MIPQADISAAGLRSTSSFWRRRADIPTPSTSYRHSWGRGKTPAEAVGDILNAADRRASRLTAHAHGLFLVRVDYDKGEG